LGAIRLAWWREALERLDANPPPPEPRLQAVATELLPRRATGAMLAGLEDGWAALLDEELDAERIAVRGEKLFAMGGRFLGATDPLLGIAGRLFAFEDVRRRGLAMMHRPTEELRQLARHSFPRRLRPLTALARLAARDARRGPEIEPEATPGRAAALLSHRLFGIVV
jgi:phytoene synthase